MTTRRIKPSVTYRMPQDIKSEISALVDSGEYANQADVMTAGLRFWLEYRRFDVAAAVREFLMTEEGRELVRAAVKKKRG